nr:FtsX-like permease family protein [uncultured Anaerosporobacter sp.]
MKLKKKTLHKDIRKSFTSSWGRFFSILCLMILGSFALVGLKVAGPDMRATGKHYFTKLNLADITVISDYGIDEDDQAVINTTSNLDKIEYGYLKDVVIKDSKTSIRIFSKPENISTYELVDGKLPETDDEIAISNSYRGEYNIGDTIEFTEKEDIAGNTVLTNHVYKVVGYVLSCEIISNVNLGQTTAGTGDLKGYAIVIPDVFDSDVYMMARLTFKDTIGVDPYSDKYIDLIQEHKNELSTLLKDRPEKRLATIKSEYQADIDEGQQKIDDAKEKLRDAKTELDDAKSKIDAAKKEVSENEQKINDAETEISTKEQELEKQKVLLSQKQKEYNTGVSTLNEKKAEMKAAKEKLDQSQKEIDTNIAELKAGKKQYTDGISLLEQQMAGINQSLENPNLTAQEQETLKTQLAVANEKLKQTKAAYKQYKTETYEPGMAKLQAAQETLDQKKGELQVAQATITTNEKKLATAKQNLTAGDQKIYKATRQLNTAKATFAENKQKLADAKVEISDNEKTYKEKLKEYQDSKVEADQEIAENEKKLADAQETLNELKAPVYSLNSRRETPGSEGYRIYDSISSIIDSLANVFPIFLYFVAALVTFTTMTRFVDEERTNSGTLKAIGYSNHDIIKKFTIYGLLSSILGSVIGIILGHTVLPAIVYSAYKTGFTLPKIELHINWGISILALILALISAVVPAYVVAKKELQDKPANLLLPKPPTSGSKIFLEYITPIWNRMSFTHKVTARNIFRYKKRMFMTIFGVCGSVALLFTGFGVQHSISGIGERQFGEIAHYDLIVAKNDNLTENQEKDIDELLNSDTVKQQSPIHYEELSKVAGSTKDKQTIKLIVPEDSDTFNEYIELVNRKTNDELALKDDGAIISERLAKLLGVAKGDKITINDSNNNEITIKVTDITEMYMGHFIFMNANAYQEVFNQNYSANANLVTLTTSNKENTEIQAIEFMNLSGVKGVVQNTTLTTQIDTIVHSLDKIMKVLILVATLLAIVILYNLTNINVSERIRELSTIKVLGFYNGEVTMYIYRETLILSLFGIIVGYGFGFLLHRYIITAVPPDDVMFNPELWITTFIIPAIIIAVTTVVLGFFINKKLKHVDMLEALKSVE